MVDIAIAPSIMFHMKDKSHLEKSETIAELPLACSSEDAAVEFIEKQRWGGKPVCPHCDDADVYKMTGRDGKRNKRYLWRCRACAEQFTVRIGTIYEESRLPLKHWCYAFWRASTSKKGVAALEIMRQCQITYKSALFLMHRIRFAMAPDANSPKAPMAGLVEADETYIGGKPRPGTGPHKRGRGTKKTPVFAVVERGGNIHRRVVADVTGKTLKAAIREHVAASARIFTDEFPAYNNLEAEFAGHEVVNHAKGEYVRGEASTNTAESSFAILKRGISGIYHNVSKKHLPRYLAEFDFRWNHRAMNDGERTTSAIQSANGKRLLYKEPARV
jgi:transposase-like protein